MQIIRKVRTLLLALLVSIVPASSFAGIFVSITVAPPVLPVYTQPVCPGPNYLWTPGYWAWSDAGYYWVPGAWVVAPRAGLLWTPGYWGFGGGYYAWHTGYWGPHVGFYGGVNYGYGYTGVGFIGGRWVGGAFYYNSAVLHVNSAFIHTTYVDRTVFRNPGGFNRASFNGPGGIDARASREELSAAREQHFGPTSEQTSHEHAAGSNRGNFASVNGGRPGVGAMRRPAQNNFNGAQNRGGLENSRTVNSTASNRQQHPAGNEHYNGNTDHNNGNHPNKDGNEHDR